VHLLIKIDFYGSRLKLQLKDDCFFQHVLFYDNLLKCIIGFSNTYIPRKSCTGVAGQWEMLQNFPDDPDEE
jgi:hypothetical protein